MVARVLDGVGKPELIIQHGASPHEYSLRPSEAESLYDADLIFYSGNALSPNFVKALKNIKSETEVINLSLIKGVERLPFRTGAFFDSHSDDHDDHDTHKEHDEVKVFDPHLWLSPKNGKLWVKVIAAELSHHDPQNEKIYMDNATSAIAEIDEVVRSTKRLLSDVHEIKFIVFHDAYQYFENHFEISALGSIVFADATKPTPSRLIEIEKKLKTLKIDCAFSEPQFDTGLLKIIKNQYKVPVSVIDPVGSQIKLDTMFYPNFIKQIGEIIFHCRENGQ